MSIIKPAYKQYFKIRWSSIDNFAYNPVGTQIQVFNDLLGSAQYTEFGKKYNFENINSIKQYKETVPVHEYDDLKPYIQKILEGHQNILWPDTISWFAKSSGTTSDKSKFIPISQQCLEDTHYKSGKDVLALYFRINPDSNITDGKCLAIGGSNQINSLSKDSYYGDLSAVLLQNMPFIGNFMRAPSIEIALMSDWEKKIRAIIDEVQHDNITYMAGVPTWTLLVLKQMMEEKGVDDIYDIWPNLEMYLHGGVSFAPYRSQFQALAKSKPMRFLETYNASEGFFAAQDEFDTEGMLLFLNHGIFFEFMPLEEYGSSFPRTLQLDEVEPGKNYALVISSNAGLWRYIIGDTIQFTSLDPFRIKVSGRIKHFINAFGEEVIIENSDYAIEKACEATGSSVNEYTAAPVYMSDTGNGTHEWIIEFEKLGAPLDVFVEELDWHLQSINSDYEAKRFKDLALRMPLVHRMQRGGFNEWLKHKGKLGGQHKVPRLSNNRQYLEEILPFIDTEKIREQ